MKWAKGILSLWIVYHLICVMVVPNTQSFITQRWKNVMLPYLNTLGMHSNWQFFSPDPGPPVYFDVKTDQANGTQSAGVLFPPLKNPYFFRQTFNRRVAIVRITSNHPQLVPNVMIPYFCKQESQAINTHLSLMVVKTPSLESVKNHEQPLNDLSDRKFKILGSGSCLNAIAATGAP